MADGERGRREDISIALSLSRERGVEVRLTGFGERINEWDRSGILIAGPG